MSVTRYRNGRRFEIPLPVDVTTRYDEGYITQPTALTPDEICALQEFYPSYPHLTERIALRLLHGRDGDPDSGLLARWSGRDMPSDDYERLEFVLDVERLLGFQPPEGILDDACSGLVGAPIDPKTLELWCWRVAAHRDRMKCCFKVTGWYGLSFDLDAPLEIVRVRPGLPCPDGKLGVILTFRVIDGYACPVGFERWFDVEPLWALGRKLGVNLSKFIPWEYSSVVNQFFGMRLTATLTPRSLPPDEPPVDITFKKYFVEQRFRAYNRRVLHARSEPCPLGSKSACYQCANGVDSCPGNSTSSPPRACRKRGLIRLQCPRCAKDTWHDSDGCILCRVSNPPCVRTPVWRSPDGWRDIDLVYST